MHSGISRTFREFPRVSARMVVKWSSISETFGPREERRRLGSPSDTSPGARVRLSPGRRIKQGRQPQPSPRRSVPKRKPFYRVKGKEQTPSSRDLLRLDFGQMSYLEDTTAC
jgi:hypothetical protein